MEQSPNNELMDSKEALPASLEEIFESEKESGETPIAESIPETPKIGHLRFIEDPANRQPPPLVFPKKKWSTYLFEFFMLFLAVFLGFWADNLREENIERQREREYILSMIYDLKADTTKLGINLEKYKKIISRQDSVIEIFPQLDKGF